MGRLNYETEPRVVRMRQREDEIMKENTDRLPEEEGGIGMGPYLPDMKPTEDRLDPTYVKKENIT